MKKVTTNSLWGMFCVRSLLLMAILGFSLVGSDAYAKGTGTKDDPFIFEDGGSYSLDGLKNKPVYAQFVVPEDVSTDGVKLEVVTPQDMGIYTDETFQTEVAYNRTGSFSPFTYTIDIPNGTKKGTIYYFYDSFVMNGGNITVSYGQGTPIALKDVTPADGSTLSASSAYVTWTFNKNVRVSDATMKVGSTEVGINVMTQGYFVTADLKATMLKMYNEGTLKADDEVVITLKGVCDANNTENVLDEVVTTYKAAAKPLLLVSETNVPGKGLDNFMSYFAPNNTNALVQLEFDGSLNETLPVVKLVYGDLESEVDYYEENLTAAGMVKVLGGNMLVIDLRDKVRTPDVMVPSGTNYGIMGLHILGVKDAEGNFAYSDGSGSLGSFFYNFPYEVVSYELIPEISLIGGQTIDDAKAVELWINETGGNMTFDGVQFTYTYNNQEGVAEVSREQVTAEADPDDADATIYTIPVPNFSTDANSTVIVTLKNMVCPDGVDHSDEIIATFKSAGRQAAEAKVLSAVMSSADGSVTVDLMGGVPVAKLIADGNLDVTTSMDDQIGVLQYKVTNKTTGEIVKSVADKSEKTEAGHWQFWIPIDYVLYTENEYEMEFKGWATTDDKNYDKDPVFVSTISFMGGTEAYKYSPVTLVSPADLHFDSSNPDVILEDATDNKVDFVFSDAVTIEKAFVLLGMGNTVDCAVSMSEDNKTATVEIPEWVMTEYTSIGMSILAKDMNGLVVKGNNGEGDASYITVYCDAKFNLPVPEMVDPVDGSTVERIKTIKFGYSKGIQPTWMGKIEILDKMRNVVATSTDVTNVIPAGQEDNWDYIVQEVIVSFNNEITAGGNYTVVVPEGFFNLDLQAQGFMVKSNRECSFYLNIEGDEPQPSMNISIAPAPGVVTSLKDFDLTFNDYASCNWTYAEMPTLTTAEGEVITIRNVGWGDGDNKLVCSLAEEITAPGTYTLTIPAGAVTFNDDPDNINTEAQSFVYTIQDITTENVTIDPAEGVVESLYVFNITFDDHSEAAWGSGIPTLTDDKGNVTKITNQEFGDDFSKWNQLKLTLPEKVTAEGTYTLLLPIGSVSFENGVASTQDYRFVYTIGTPSGIANIIGANGGKADVYTVNGVMVMKGADASALKTLKPGMYIINGKTYMLK